MNIKLTTRILALLLLTCFILPANAKVIDQATAEKAAKNYMFEKLSQKKHVTYNDVVVSTTYSVTDNGTPVYYGVNFRDGGFVIITADDIVKPVIGYSPSGLFKFEMSQDNFASWMNIAKEQIVSARSQGVSANARISSSGWA